VKVKIKKLSPLAVIPKYAKPGDAGMDLTATSYSVADGGRHVYGTGIAIEIPEGYVGLLFPRSSLVKHDLRLANSVGVIDSQYRGEIRFIFESNGMNQDRHTKAIYKVGDRIGQIIIMPYPKILFLESDELSDTERGAGGFGSSGK
jgi:dUTP pyrophosphatase